MLAAKSLFRVAGPTILKSFPAVQVVAQPYLCRYMGTVREKKDKNPKPFVYDDSLDMVNIQDLASQIDTTLTPEQKIYVDKLKKKIRGGPLSVRCKREQVLSFLIY